MAKLKKLLAQIGTFYEVNLSAIILFCMIALFCAQIFIRYVLRGDTFLVSELSVIAFGWTSIIGASYGFRKNRKYGDGHVKFTVLYDLFSETGKRIIRIVVNLIIVFVFAYMMPATWRTIVQNNISKTPVLKLPFSYIYFPFLIFLILSMVHSAKEVFDDIKGFFPSKSMPGDQNAE